MYDPLRALRTFQRHDVRYVVIGGYAAGILGAPIVTNDLDICYERSKGNMDRLAAALKELGAKLRVAHVDEELPFILDGRNLATGDSFTFRTDVGDLDVLATPSGTAGFRDLDAKATTFDLGDGLLARVVSLDDLIRMKEAARRPKDESHLHVLTALKRTIERTEQTPPA
ncbi:MAG TPA: hypothetical protein VF244_03290 [Acidimicrobiales bacterium]